MLAPDLLPAGGDTPPADAVRLQSVAAPFRAERVTVHVRAGQTIDQMLLDQGLTAAWTVGAMVWIDDWFIPADRWHVVKPRAGRTVLVRVIPQGGGGGGKVLRTVLTLAVIVAAAYVAGPVAAGGLGYGASVGTALGVGAFAGTALLTAGISMLGMLAINALVPPASSSGSSATSYSLAPGSNRGRLWQPIPLLLGRARIYPDYAATPVTETVGNDQYLRLLYCAGYGPLDISDIKLGDTPIESYNDVQVEVRQGYATDDPITLWTDIPVEIEPGVQLRAIDGWVTREINAIATGLQADFLFPNGVWKIVDGNNHKPNTAQVEVQYGPIDSDAWVAAPGSPLTVTVEDTSPIRRSLDWSVPSGRYQMRVRRTIDHDGDTNYADSVAWMAMRARQPGYPIKFGKPVALIAVRIRANSQLNGAVQDLNCIAQSILPDWDATAGTWITRPTSNPAACYLALLQGPSNYFPRPDKRIDWVRLQDWAEANQAAGRWMSWYCTDEASVLERLRKVAAIGRAQYINRDGRYSVVRDIIQDVPSNVFGPKNSWGFRASRTFTKQPHAIRVRFRNPLQGWAVDERVVYADGYDESTATIFETLDQSELCADHDLAWADARYHWAVGMLRPWSYQLNTDIQNFGVVRGDRVEVQHDALEIGLTSGRLAAVSADHLSVTTDERIDADGSQAYAVLFRLAGGDTELVGCTVGATGGTHTLNLVAAVPGLAPGDSFFFGIAGRVSAPMLVTGIEPGKDESALLRLVDYAPGVHEAETGTIPPWDSNLTAGTPLPNVTGLTVVETLKWVAGVYQPTLVINWDRTDDLRVDGASCMALTPTGAWINVPLTRPTGADISPAALGLWAISVWNTSSDGRRSVAAAVAEHTVDGIGDLVAPHDMTITGSLEYLAAGTPVPALLVTWTPSSEVTGESAVVRWRASGSTDWLQSSAGWGLGQVKLYPVIEGQEYEVQIAVTAAGGVRSAWSDSVFYTFANVLDGASVSGLELYGQGLDTEFTGKDIHLVWRGNFPSTSADFGSEAFGAGSGFVNPYFQSYAVTVIEPDSGKALRTDLVTDPEYFYLFDSMNAKDAGGPHRRLTFSVTIRDKLGGETAPATITVNNPVPASVQLQALPNTLNTLFAFIAPVGDDALDFAGVNVWVGASTTVDTSGVPVASGTTAPLVVSGLTPGATYYAVSQTFDTFGTAGCPITAPLQFQVPYLTSAQIAANTIGKDQLVLDLVSQIDLVTDGADVPGSVAAQIAAEAAQRVAAVQAEATARATAIEAEATARANAILASAQTLQAHIDTVSTAQQGTADSLASTTTTLTAAINGNAAAIQTEQTARVNGDSANASSITTLASEVHNPTTGLSAAFAAITSEATTRATADSANASATSTLSAQVNDSNTGLAKTRADLLTEQTARADGDSANASSITTLASEVHNPTTGLSAAFAAITSEATTRATADSANASATSTLSAQVNNASTGLPATYAGLQSEMTARATGDSANATAITNLTTTVNGNTASISTLQSSVNGLNAQYVLKLDVNGYVAGFGVANSGSTSTFVIRTDTFALVPPGSTVAQSPFFVTAAGQVVIHNGFIENLDAATITTGTLGNGVIYAGTINASQINSSSIGGKVFWATATGNNDGSAGIYIDGPSRNIWISDGTRTRARMGFNGTEYAFESWDGAGRQLFNSNDLGVGVASGMASVSAYQDGSSITVTDKGAWTTITTVPAFQVRGNPCDIKVVFSATPGTAGAANNPKIQVVRTNTRTGATAAVGATLSSAPYQWVFTMDAFSDPGLDTYTFTLQGWRPADTNADGVITTYAGTQYWNVYVQVRWFR
ncbi:host specificity factor TipJ family phage tail protein [Azospirillum sp. B4]|uniref:host specificity factor TipJ family phage tail protein n=1 Tax=Azospirillum sp. B4 TaxID=95605 RepID=UPI000346F568|nr:host specificity factor TipJ family phage tail protein [Azospirillum sp. B4]